MSGNDLQMARLMKDSIPLRAYNILEQIGRELRIPTVERLLCDLLGIVNCDARAVIAWLVEVGNLIENGGWVRVRYKYYKL